MPTSLRTRKFASMLIQGLDDDHLLDLYRTLPPGSEMLDKIHSEIMRRGEGVWGRIEAVYFQDLELTECSVPAQRASLWL